MRVAITGSTSLLGQHLRRILSKDAHVLMLGRSDVADLSFDITKRDSDIEALRGFDALVHCAAEFADNSLAGFQKNFSVNTQGTINTLELAHNCRIRHFVYISSIFAIEDPRNVYFGSYGLSKLAAKRSLSLLHETSDANLTIIRPSQLYDTEGLAARHQGMFYFLLDRVQNSLDVTLFGGRDVERNFLHVEDLANAIKHCVEHRVAGTFNAVHPTKTRLSEVVATMTETFLSTSELAFDPDKPDLANMYFPQNDSIFDQMPVDKPRSLREGLEQIKDYRCGLASGDYAA